MSVRAAVLDAPGAAVEIVDVELDPPHAGEVEVAIAAAGVCGSDVHVVAGDWEVPMPVVLGHEGAGVVVDVLGEDAAVGAEHGNARTLGRAAHLGADAAAPLEAPLG